MRARFVRSRRAVDVVKVVARPALERAGEQVAHAIVDHVPVHRGVVRGTFRPEVAGRGDDVRVQGFGPFWHWLEYGTAFNAPYRPIERGVQSVGLEWEAH